MKPLFWTRIQTGNVQPVYGANGMKETTIWELIDDLEVDGNVLEDNFGKAVMKPKETKEVKEVQKVEGGKKIIEGKKSTNLGIFLKSKKIDVDFVRQVLVECDNSEMDAETLEQLLGYKSPEDELSMLQDHVNNKPEEPLDGPDQFLYDMSKIHMLDHRMTCMLFQFTFSGLCEDISIKLEYMKTCCRFLSKNQDLKQVLTVILACGNYLNGGNKQRGQADGFALDILPKIKDVKTKDNFSNLLNYVVRVWIEKFDENKGTPEAILPVPEPGDIDKARNLDFEAERADCNKLFNEVDSVQKKIFLISERASEEVKEPFDGKMRNFIAKAQAQIKNLKEDVEETFVKFVDCMKYYKYAPKKGKLEDVKPTEFLDSWYIFCDDFKNAWKKEQLQIRAELAKKEKKLMRENSLSIKTDIEVRYLFSMLHF